MDMTVMVSVMVTPVRGPWPVWASTVGIVEPIHLFMTGKLLEQVCSL